MTITQDDIPIKTLHLFPVLDRMLNNLLKSLSSEEWQLPTVAKLWTVKDVASHLLDGNLRILSISRDHYFGEMPLNINTYKDLVAYLNQLNSSWTNATKRLSPNVLIELLEITGKQYTAHLESLNPLETAIFSVAWAGQNKSKNWFHIAREYTEKFLHQQQIREAVNKQALFTKELFYPFINTFMYALPNTYRNVNAKMGTTVKIKVSTEIGGEWTILKTKTTWQFITSTNNNPNAIISLNPDTAWKLFSKSITPEEAVDHIEILGDSDLGKHALQMVSVMA